MVCWLEVGRWLHNHGSYWKWKGRFSAFGFGLGFFCIRELWLDVNKVGFCDLSLMEHGTEMFTWGLWCCESWCLFLYLLWDIISHSQMRSEVIFLFIFIIYWMVNLIFAKSGLKLMFSEFFQAFRSRTPLLRKKSMYLARLEGISNDETWVFLI